MTLEDLRAFVVAYKTENLSEAARQLKCTQGAVAQHVRRLELDLKAPLFLRARRGVTPTAAGRLLYEGASIALANLDAATREVERHLKQKETRLSLAASVWAAGGLLRPSILAMKKRYPDLVVGIENDNIADSRLQAVREGRADLTMIPLTEKIAGLEIRQCLNQELVLLVHYQHRFANRKCIAASELTSIRYVAQGSTSAIYQHVAKSLRDADVVLEPSCVVEDPRGAILMVEANCGETFVPRAEARKLETNGLVKGVSVSLLQTIKMCWAARRFASLPDVAKEFLDEFDRHVQEDL